LERWHLGYDELAAVNPRIVLTRVTGYGQTGPYAPRAGFGAIGEAMGGLRYVLGEPDRPPSRAGISIGDSLAATYACIGTLAALQERERSGRGQVVDSAIYEAVLAMMESLVPEWQVGGYQRERTGAILPNIAPSNVYPTAGGESVVIGANQDSVFRRLAAAMGEPGLADDERYATHGARGARQAELDERIAAWTAGLDADGLLAVLDAAGVPAGRIYRPRDLLRDPQVIARGSLVTVPDPAFGPLAMQNVAPRLSRTPGGVRWTGPALGEHTREVLRGLLGYTDEEIAALR
jgi:formyl-CoA transferase